MGHSQPDEEDWTVEETGEAVQEEKRLVVEHKELKDKAAELNTSKSNTGLALEFARVAPS